MKQKTHISARAVVLGIGIIATGLSAVSLANLYIIHKHNEYAFENHSEIQYSEIAQAKLDSAWNETNMRLTHGN